MQVLKSQMLCLWQGYLKCVCKSSNTQGSVKTVEDTGDTPQQQYGLYNMENVTIPRAADNNMWLQ